MDCFFVLYENGVRENFSMTSILKLSLCAIFSLYFEMKFMKLILNLFWIIRVKFDVEGYNNLVNLED